jgi:hypothetical protein
MSILTTWGYSLTDVDEIPGMMTLSEFNSMTAEKYLADSRVEPDIKAASSAIREFCGWHVYPSQACELNTTFFDKRVSVVDRMLLIQLPATFVSSIELIQIGDEVIDETYVLMPNGILRVYGFGWSRFKMWTPVVIRYTAGLPESAADGIKELVAHRVTHALASSEGVQSETAGGVSVTYNANWVNNSRATALADDNKEVLSPYRLRGVF